MLHKLVAVGLVGYAVLRSMNRSDDLLNQLKQQKMENKRDRQEMERLRQAKNWSKQKGHDEFEQLRQKIDKLYELNDRMRAELRATQDDTKLNMTNCEIGSIVMHCPECGHPHGFDFKNTVTTDGQKFKHPATEQMEVSQN